MMRMLTLGILVLLAGGPLRAGRPVATAPVRTERVFLTVDEALALAFPKAKIERGRVFLTDAQKKRAEKLAKRKIAQGIVRPYTAHDAAGKLLGTAYLDTHGVRTMRETIMVVVGPGARVRRIELLSFGEPPDYIPRRNWYAQFTGRKLDDKLILNRGIKGVTGATLTARATTDAVRRVLALHMVLHPRTSDEGTDAPEREEEA